MNTTIQNVTEVVGLVPGTPRVPRLCAPFTRVVPCAARPPNYRRRHAGAIGRLPLAGRNPINRTLADGSLYSGLVTARLTPAPTATFPESSRKTALIIGRFVKVCEGL